MSRQPNNISRQPNNVSRQRLGVGPLAVVAVLRRPHLWGTATKALLQLAPRTWWKQRPFLPLPDQRWLAFRLETAYGGAGDHPISPADLVTWLQWKRLLKAQPTPNL